MTLRADLDAIAKEIHWRDENGHERCDCCSHAGRLVQGLRLAHTALLHVSVTSSRYRSHRMDCGATCTCDAIQDDKLIRAELNRVIQQALAALDAIGADTGGA